MLKTIVVVLCGLQLVLCQQRPVIVNEIDPKLFSYGLLDCTVMNKVPTQPVVWGFINRQEVLQEISIDEKVVDTTLCPDGSQKYQVVRLENNGQITFTLLIGCLVIDDYGQYDCLIRIQGENERSWPHKYGYLNNYD